MSSPSSFEIARFKNRNGTSSWRVSGWLHGVRIRKHLGTREEVAVEKTCWKSGAEVLLAELQSEVRSAALNSLRSGMASERDKPGAD